MRLEDILQINMMTRGISTIESDKARWFVINYGPPASGKNSVKKNKEIVELIQSNFLDIDIDVIVSDLFFQQGNTDITNLTQELYWTLRKTANEKSDNILINSIIVRNNIIWETTGRDRSYIKYVVDFVKQYGYHVLLTIPIVYLDTEIARCRSRKQPANCSFEYISDIRLKSYNNFKYVASDCDRVLIFDNNNKLFVIYDSTKESCGDITNILSDPNITDLHNFIIDKCKPRTSLKQSKKRTRALTGPKTTV